MVGFIKFNGQFLPAERGDGYSLLIQQMKIILNRRPYFAFTG
jgi:hypothetical protein